MSLALLATFWVSLAVCGFVYVGYPAVLYLVSRVRRRPVRRGPVRPRLSVIVPVFNEEEVVGSKIANTLEQEYPPAALEIVVVSDGSTDGTEATVARCADPRLRLLSLPRRGKIAALNAGAAAASGEVLVFTDANSRLAPQSLLRLVEPFADPEVGGVCGNMVYLAGESGDSTQQGEGAYWRFDKWQKTLESSIGSIFAADGSLYAVRRELFVPVDDPAQADDIAISTRVVLQGRRLVFEPAAVAYEESPAEGRQELARKVRVTIHSVRALLLLRSGLWTAGFYSFELVFHKLLRHMVPLFLIPLFATSLALAGRHPFFGLALGGQIVVFALGALGFALRNRRAGRSRLLSIPYFFVLVNTAAFLGLLAIVRGRRPGAWTPRSGAQQHDGV